MLALLGAIPARCIPLFWAIRLSCHPGISKGNIMSRVILPIILTMATVTVGVLVGARVRERGAPHSDNETSQVSTSPRPLILQEGDGEHLVRRTGPTAGWPFTIKLDGQIGNTQDFFVFTSTMAPG